MKKIILAFLLSLIAPATWAANLQTADISIQVQSQIDIRGEDNTFTGLNEFQRTVTLSSDTIAANVSISSAVVSTLTVVENLFVDADAFIFDLAASSITVTTITVNGQLSIPQGGIVASSAVFGRQSINTTDTAIASEETAFLIENPVGVTGLAIQTAGGGAGAEGILMGAEAGDVGIDFRTAAADIEFEILDTGGSSKGKFGMTFNGNFFINDNANTANRIVPSGMIVLSTSSCPSGWTEFNGANGRYLVGVPAGGTVAGTVGSGMSNLSNASHDHSATPTSATASAGATQSVATPAAITTSAVDRGDIAPYIQLRLCVVP